MGNIEKYPKCHMRTSLGNCNPIGGFCTSVNTDICEALHKVADRPTEWIPVSERLPDKEECVLVTDNGNIEFGKLICGLFGDLWLIWVDDCWTEATKVTAWMSLPEPYKGETNGKM